MSTYCEYSISSSKVKAQVVHQKTVHSNCARLPSSLLIEAHCPSRIKRNLSIARSAMCIYHYAVVYQGIVDVR